MGYFLKNPTINGTRRVLSRRGKAHLAATLYRLKDPAARGHKRYWQNSGTVCINPPGQRQKLRTAGNERTAVMLIPLKFTRETTPGSGDFQPIKDNGLDDKAQLPIYTTESGSGLSVSYNNTYSFSAQLSTNLSGSSTASMVVAFTNSSGTFSGTVTETSAGSGVFTNTGSTFTVTLSPTTQTTSSTTVDTLNVTVTDSALGLSSAPFTLLEDSASSNGFAALQIETVVTLSGTLSTTAVNTIELSLSTSANPATLDTTLTETAVNSRIFHDTSGTAVTMTGYSGGTSMSVSISTSHYLPVSSFSTPLTETSGTSLQYANVTRTSADVTVNSPSTDGEGIFYVEFPGSTATDITLVSGSNSVTTTASPVSGHPGLLRTGKLALLSPGDTFSGSGITTLTVNPPSGGGAATVKLKMYGQTIVDPGTAQNAFIGECLRGGLPDNIATIQSIITQKLGWTAPVTNKAMTKADMVAAVPTHNLWYSFGHGNTPDAINPPLTDFDCWTSHYVWDYGHGYLHPSDVSGVNNPGGVANVYSLVFFNSCYSNDGGTAAVAFKSAFNATAYVGWNGAQNPGIATGNAADFLTDLDSGTPVGQAVGDVNSHLHDHDTVGIHAALDVELVLSGDSSEVIDLTPSSQ